MARHTTIPHLWLALKGLKENGKCSSVLLMCFNQFQFTEEQKHVCKEVRDVGLILDGSGSISRRNWLKMKTFAKAMIDKFNVSEDGTHVGIIEYSTNATLAIKFNDLTGEELTPENIYKKVDEMKQSKQLTYIDRALQLANDELFQVRNGMREEVKKVRYHIIDRQTDRQTDRDTERQ